VQRLVIVRNKLMNKIIQLGIYGNPIMQLILLLNCLKLNQLKIFYKNVNQ